MCKRAAVRTVRGGAVHTPYSTKDLLKTALPGARTFFWGYNSRLRAGNTPTESSFAAMSPATNAAMIDLDERGLFYVILMRLEVQRYTTAPRRSTARVTGGGTHATARQ